MAEQEMYGVLHCEPCEECVEEAWQLIGAGGLYWESSFSCSRYGIQACDWGQGVPPPEVREGIVAREGTVHLAVGGADGVPVGVLRRVYRLSIAEVMAARRTGCRATPMEARYLRSATS